MKVDLLYTCMTFAPLPSPKSRVAVAFCPASSFTFNLQTRGLSIGLTSGQSNPFSISRKM